MQNGASVFQAHAGAEPASNGAPVTNGAPSVNGAVFGPLTLSVGYASDPGLKRAENQDAVGFRMPHDPHEAQARGSIFVVCDGIGGFQGGRKASRVAVREFIRAYYAASPRLPEGATADQFLREASRQANTMAYEAARRARVLGHMGTTLVAAAVVGAGAWVLNVGDSRAYLWRAGQMRQLSEDHVPKYRGAHDRRIERAIGTDERVTPFVLGPFLVQPGDRLLLCTDGLTTAASDTTIAAVLQTFSPPEAARQLIERAKTGGAADNVSVVVVGFDGIESVPLTNGASGVWSSGRSAVVGSGSTAPNGGTFVGSGAVGQWRDKRGFFGRITSFFEHLLSMARNSPVVRRWALLLYVVVLVLVLLAGLLIGRLIGRLLTGA